MLLLGQPGVVKTHLAVALALRSIENGQGAYFVRDYDLMEDLRKARKETSGVDNLVLNLPTGFNGASLFRARKPPCLSRHQSVP